MNPMKNPEVVARHAGVFRKGHTTNVGRKRPDQSEFMKTHNPMENSESRKRISMANKGRFFQGMNVSLNPKRHNAVVKERVETLRSFGADVLFVDGGFARPDIIYILNDELIAEDVKTSKGKLVRVERDFQRKVKLIGVDGQRR